MGQGWLPGLASRGFVQPAFIPSVLPLPPFLHLSPERVVVAFNNSSFNDQKFVVVRGGGAGGGIFPDHSQLDSSQKMTRCKTKHGQQGENIPAVSPASERTEAGPSNRR